MMFCRSYPVVNVETIKLKWLTIVLRRNYIYDSLELLLFEHNEDIVHS